MSRLNSGSAWLAVARNVSALALGMALPLRCLLVGPCPCNWPLVPMVTAAHLEGILGEPEFGGGRR